MISSKSDNLTQSYSNLEEINIITAFNRNVSALKKRVLIKKEVIFVINEEVLLIKSFI